MKRPDDNNNFYYLCVALLVMLLSSALVTLFPGTWGEEVFSFLTVAMLFLSIKSLRTDLGWRRLVFTLAFTLILINVLERIFPSRVYFFLILILLFLFFASSLRSAARQILFAGRVDANQIAGSLSLYLLLGLLWTLIYLLILTLVPDAFSGIEAGDWRRAFARVAYYSFVTLTTLGYGDILPRHPLAEFFAYLEAVVGVFYLAIVVASLVSRYLVSGASGNGDRLYVDERKNGPRTNLPSRFIHDQAGSQF